MFLLFAKYQVINQTSIVDIGGVIGITFFTTAASQGIQYIAISFANREIGNTNRNVIFGLSINIMVTAVAACGFNIIKPIFIAAGLISAVFLFFMGLASDIRSVIYPQGGVGIFFGTFNPFHNTHLQLIKNVIEERHLKKVYLHSTIIPKLHLDALANNEIKIDKYYHGMRIYKKTNKADIHVNYFPTGNRFHEALTRKKLIELALKEAGLSDKVEVLYLPDIYEHTGFYGIIKYIKKMNPGECINGVHGSDLGGMWIRRIYDESGWIYPYAVKRINKVSATAIRNGAKNMAPRIVEKILSHLNNSENSFRVDNMNVSMRDGVLYYEEK